MKFTANTTTGNWLDKKTLKTGDIVKLTSEAKEVSSSQGGIQVVAKCKVKGQPGESNISINKPSKNALIEVFGDDSVNWVDKPLGVHVEKTMIAGKRGVACYLVPEGYQVTEDDGGYLVIVKLGLQGSAPTPMKSIAEDEQINPEDIPF